MSENRLIGVVVTTAIGILIAVTGGIIYAKTTRDEARRQGIVALGNDLSAAISHAKALQKDLGFQDAVDVFQTMQPRIETTRNSELADQLNQAFYDVTEAEADYKDKIKKGYTVFEGKMVSPKQKEETLAKRKKRKNGGSPRKNENSVRGRALTSLRLGISSEHWKYREYPGMAIAIVGRASGGWVWCIGTYR